MGVCDQNMPRHRRRRKKKKKKRKGKERRKQWRGGEVARNMERDLHLQPASAGGVYCGSSLYVLYDIKWRQHIKMRTACHTWGQRLAHMTETTGTVHQTFYAREKACYVKGCADQHTSPRLWSTLYEKGAEQKKKKDKMRAGGIESLIWNYPSEYRRLATFSRPPQPTPSFLGEFFIMSTSARPSSYSMRVI